MRLSYFDLRRQPSRRKAVLWQTMGNYASNAIIIIQGLVMIPLYLQTLGAELYGFWLASGGMLAWLSMVDVGGAAITRVRCANAYGRGDLQRMVDYFWHGAGIMASVILIFLLLLLVMVRWIPELIQVDLEFRELILDCLYITGLGTALHLSELFLREFIFSTQRTLLPSLGTLVGLIISLLFLLLGLIVFNWGLYALALAAVIRPLLPLLLNLFVAAGLLQSAQARVNWSKKVFRDYCATTPSVLAAKASGVFLYQLPVILLTRLAGPEVTVAYNVTMRLLEMAKHFINQPLSSLYNSSAHLFGDQSVRPAKTRSIFSKLSLAFSLSTLAAFGTYILLNQGFVHLWVSPEKYLGVSFTVLAALAALLQMRSILYTSLIGAHGSINVSGYTGSVERITTALLMFLLVGDYGPFGVVIALIVGPILFQVPYHFLLRKRQPVVAQSLFPLQWVWIPAGILFWAASLCTHWWVFDSWTQFILAAALLMPLPASLVIGAIPQIRERLGQTGLRRLIGRCTGIPG